MKNLVKYFFAVGAGVILFAVVSTLALYVGKSDALRPFSEQEAEDTAEDTDAAEEEAEDAAHVLPEFKAQLKEAQVEVAAQPTADQEGLFYYEALSASEQEVYEQIYDAIVSRGEVVLSTLDAGLADKLYQCVLNDHPELFETSGYVLEQRKRDEQVFQLSVSSKYHMTQEQEEQNRQLIEQEITTILAAMPQGLDQYGQVKFVFEYLISNTEYVLGSENNQNICSVFLTHKSVCQGYAKATQYLLKQLGFEVTLVYGTAMGENHVWNLVRVDGDYYFLDTTWGDAGYRTRDGSRPAELVNAQTVNYDYLLITSQQLERTHVIDNIVPIPACVSMTDNYYNREGLYFTDRNLDKLKLVFEKAYAQEKESVAIMCSTQALFDEMMQYLIEEQHVFEYVHTAEQISYSCTEEMYTISISLY